MGFNRNLDSNSTNNSMGGIGGFGRPFGTNQTADGFAGMNGFTGMNGMMVGLPATSSTSSSPPIDTSGISSSDPVTNINEDVKSRTSRMLTGGQGLGGGAMGSNTSKMLLGA